MKNLILTFLFLCSFFITQAQYDNSEKISLLGGFTSTGSEFVFWNDNVYGGNFSLVYDVKKIHEGAIGLKGTGAWSSGYSGYYGGLNFRVGSRFFLDLDALYGYSSITNEKLLPSYTVDDEYKGGAFIGNMGVGYRFPDNPFFVRLAYIGHFATSNQGINTAFNLQLGYRLQQ